MLTHQFSGELVDSIGSTVFDLGMDSLDAPFFVGTLGNTQLFLDVAVELICLKFLAIATGGVVF